MTIDELVEQVARAIALAEYDGNEIFYGMATHTKTSRRRLPLQARAALRAAIGPLMEMAAGQVRDNDDAANVCALAAEMQEKLG